MKKISQLLICFLLTSLICPAVVFAHDTLGAFISIISMIALSSFVAGICKLFLLKRNTKTSKPLIFLLLLVAGGEFIFTSVAISIAMSLQIRSEYLPFILALFAALLFGVFLNWLILASRYKNQSGFRLAILLALMLPVILIALHIIDVGNYIYFSLLGG